MSNHNHVHKCKCEHENVKFCKPCNRVYCQDCSQEWTTYFQNYTWNYTQPHVYGNTPNIGTLTGDHQRGNVGTVTTGASNPLPNLTCSSHGGSK
jgi:hypothetical protein